MRVRVQPGDNQGVGNYRINFPAAAAAQAGVDIEYPTPGKRLLERRLKVPGNGRTATMQFMPGVDLDCDVLVIQRPSNQVLVDLIPMFQRKGIAIVVDIDDDLAAVHHGNAAKGAEDPRQILRACAIADMVTVSTPPLAARYGAHGRVTVLPNRVPERLLDLSRDSDGRTVGWAGWVGVHPEDLQVTQGGVAQAIKDTGARYLQIGPVDGVRAALGLDEEPDATGGLPLDDYHEALGRLDVGITPLQDSAFNRAKSWLKALELTARGVAVVMSPRPEYSALHGEGVGLVAKDRGRSWRSQVRVLLEDHELRREVACQGREIVRESHTYERAGHLWAEAWSGAVENHRAQARKVGLRVAA